MSEQAQDTSGPNLLVLRWNTSTIRKVVGSPVPGNILPARRLDRLKRAGSVISRSTKIRAVPCHAGGAQAAPVVHLAFAKQALGQYEIVGEYAGA